MSLVLSADETTGITFFPDGTYVFRAADGSAEESGQYAYVDKTLTLVSGVNGEEIKVGKTSSKLRYTTADGAYKQEYGIKALKEMFVIEETAQYVPEAYTVTSADETTSLTFNPDGAYVFEALSGSASARICPRILRTPCTNTASASRRKASGGKKHGCDHHQEHVHQLQQGQNLCAG